MLIDAGANVNSATSDGMGAIAFAAWGDNADAMRLLASAGANVDERSMLGNIGNTPLMRART